MGFKHATSTAILVYSVYILTTVWGGHFETEKILTRLRAKHTELLKSLPDKSDFEKWY